jgi:single-stranded DNA-binding protein
MNVGSYVGNIGKIGEITKTKTGQDMLRFSIAVETQVKDKPIWVSVLCFGDQVAVAQRLTVGSKVFVSGNQQFGIYNNLPSVSIIGNIINIIFSKKVDTTGTVNRQAPEAPAAPAPAAPDKAGTDPDCLPF